MNAEGLGSLGNELHHGHGADGENLVKLLAGLQQLLQGLGDQTMTAIGTVVGHENEAVGNFFELVLKNDDVLAAETDNDGDLGAGFLKAPGRGQSNGTAHAAANDTDLLLTLNRGRLAQRANKVPDVVTLVQLTQGLGGEANLLEDDGDGAGLLVGTGDSQGNTLAHLINAENDELACLCFAGNEGGLNVHQGDGGIELLLTHNFIHF